MRGTFGDTLDRFFGSHGEQAGDLTSYWQEAKNLGLTLVGVNEKVGGAGGSLADSVELLTAVGKYAVPLPLAASALAGWLCEKAEVPLEEPFRTVAVPRPGRMARLDGNRLNGVIEGIPWAESADSLVTVVATGSGEAIVGVSISKCGPLVSRPNLADEPRASLSAEDVPVLFAVPAPNGGDAASLRSRAALTHSAMMVGALDRVTSMTVRYAGEREQFGRQIRRFQAVQQHLVTCAQETEMAKMACSQAVSALEQSSAWLEVAAAKIVANEAARVVSRSAHQVHGAIGFTREHSLQQFTRRLASWRSENGSTEAWAADLGGRLEVAGADALYPLIAGTGRTSAHV